MRIYFDYPNATEENMKTIQEAIDQGNDTEELFELFDENVVWDCLVVMTGNRNTPWALLDKMDGHEQYGIEGWQYEMIDEFIDTLRN